VEKHQMGFAVVSPVGRASVEPVMQAPRLATLSGKTIAVVGESFMTRVTHPEIKRLIEENYPSAKVILLDEIGIAGPYPALARIQGRRTDDGPYHEAWHDGIHHNGRCGQEQSADHARGWLCVGQDRPSGGLGLPDVGAWL